MYLDPVKDVYYALWAFLIFGFLGVLAEMIYCYASQYRGVIESRCGLLYLPLSPIYGFGGVAISIFLIPLEAQPLLLFLLAIIICTVLEYIGSYVMEKVWGSVFWDYSKKPLNLHGRICLQYSLMWGFLGLLLIYVIDPSTVGMIDSWDTAGALWVLGALLLLTALSAVLTLLAFRRYDQKVAYIKAERDGQPLPNLDTPVGRLVDRLVPEWVMINTFPRMSHIVDYQNLTGRRRKLIVADLHLGTPSERRRHHQAALEHARATEGVAG